MERIHLDPPEVFAFPFSPYNIQHEFMKTLFSVIENKELGIFESPTGTGKSLSIICGAIRWLKDYLQKERAVIQDTLEQLEAQKQELTKSSTDWLSSQAQEIELLEKFNKLKLHQTKIINYDKKMDEIKSSSKSKQVQKCYEKSVKKEDNDVPVPQDTSSIEDEDDILLEEVVNVPQESESDDDEDDDKYEPPKIFITSRTHSQLSQFVGEILKSPFKDDIRVVSLASRQNYCVNPNVLKLKNMALINEKCLDMQSKTSACCKVDSDGRAVKKQKGSGKCPYFRQNAIDELRDLALSEVVDIEDLVIKGKEIKACPYYASRKAAIDAEVVLIPYNTLLHKSTREANGIKLKNNIVIIDEAHNLLEALSNMHNCELSYNQLEFALLQLRNYKQRYNTRFSALNLLSINQLIFVTSKLFKVLDTVSESTEPKTTIFTLENFVLTAQIDNYNMFKLIDFCQQSRISQKLHSFATKYTVEEMQAKTENKGLKKFLSSIENKKGKKIPEPEVRQDSAPKKQPPSNPLMAVIAFLQALTYSCQDGRILVHKTSAKDARKLQFLLLNPASNFKDIVSEARSVIVAGGTMKPNAEFRDRLFINAGANPERIVEFSCDHIIPAENILPIIMTKGLNGENLLFNFENRMSMVSSSNRVAIDGTDRYSILYSEVQGSKGNSVRRSTEISNQLWQTDESSKRLKQYCLLIDVSGPHIKSILKETCNKIRGGIVVFFPSYKYENWVWEQMKSISLGRPVFREPQDSGSVDTVLTEYAQAIKSNGAALLLSVVGGKLSEGLNFSDDLGRCVVVVGLPYANIMAVDLKEKMAFLDKTVGVGTGQKFYEGLCMKAVNQCIGRAVRHKDDYATVLLLDQRYNRQATKNALPGWISRSLKEGTFQECFQMIGKFYTSIRKRNY